jgi:putative addiction module component (TIGR02574 family)
MTLANFPQLAKLPKRQRMKLAEELWFSSVDDSLPIHSGHKKILDERWAAHKAGKARRVSSDELHRRLTRT